MKKLACMLLAATMLCGCAPGVTSPEHAATVLTAADWQGHDGTCTNTLVLETDGGFSNICACGDPVGDSDLVASYRLREDGHTIELLDADGAAVHTGEVLYVDGAYLIMRLWDRVYTYENTAGYIPAVRDSVKPLVGTDALTKPCLTILGYDGDTLTVSAFNYDHDAAANYKVWELKADRDLTVSSVSVTVMNGEEETIETAALDASDYAAIGENYHSGYFTLSPEGFVTDIVFYGELLIRE